MLIIRIEEHPFVFAQLRKKKSQERYANIPQKNRSAGVGAVRSRMPMALNNFQGVIY